MVGVYNRQFTLRSSAPKNAGRVHADLVEDHVDGLVGVEVEVHRPLAVAVAEVERPGAIAFVAELGDGHLGPLTGRAPPDWSAFMDGDGLAPSGDLEAHLVFEFGGNVSRHHRLTFSTSSSGRTLATPKA